MFLLMAFTHWISWLIAYISVGQLLWKFDHSAYVLIMGFYSLSLLSKTVGEYMMYKKKQEAMAFLKNQVAAVENLGDKNETGT